MVDKPVVLETHGGNGEIFSRCYSHLESGVVFEKDLVKVALLGKQRPTWAVYEADCIGALAAGVGSHLPVNFLDLDPYGDPWPVIDAFFEGRKDLPSSLAIVVNERVEAAITQPSALERGVEWLTQLWGD